jgi:hypothetical protein
MDFPPLGAGLEDPLLHVNSLKARRPSRDSFAFSPDPPRSAVPDLLLPPLRGFDWAMLRRSISRRSSLSWSGGVVEWRKPWEAALPRKTSGGTGLHRAVIRTWRSAFSRGRCHKTASDSSGPTRGAARQPRAACPTCASLPANGQLMADGSSYSFGSTMPFCDWYLPLRSA